MFNDATLDVTDEDTGAIASEVQGAEETSQQRVMWTLEDVFQTFMCAKSLLSWPLTVGPDGHSVIDVELLFMGL